jgi:hypothetical protein
MTEPQKMMVDKPPPHKSVFKMTVCGENERRRMLIKATDNS